MIPQYYIHGAVFIWFNYTLVLPVSKKTGFKEWLKLKQTKINRELSFGKNGTQTIIQRHSVEAEDNAIYYEKEWTNKYFKDLFNFFRIIFRQSSFKYT